MDQIMGKVGGYWFSQKANANMNGAGDDLNVRKRCCTPHPEIAVSVWFHDFLEKLSWPSFLVPFVILARSLLMHYRSHHMPCPFFIIKNRDLRY